MEARNRGVVFIDDSPENLKSPSSFNQHREIDLTRTQEIQSRYTLAQQIKNECWELIGMSKQRMGSVSASESATGTNAAIQQSYSQTEPLFVAHEYVLGQLYQAIVDAALYIESAKPQSTLSYVTSEGESAFVQVNGSDLKLRDLKVFLTNRPEDTQMFNELRQLAQPLMQNGGSLYDVIELYSTKSTRELKKVFKDLRDKVDAQQAQAAQQQQQQIEQQGQIAQAQMQQIEVDNATKIGYAKAEEALAQERLAKIQSDIAVAEEKIRKSHQEDTQSLLNVAKILKELQNLDMTHLKGKIETLQMINNLDFDPQGSEMARQEHAASLKTNQTPTGV